MMNIHNLFKKAGKLVGLVALLTGIIFCLLSSGLRAEEEIPIPVRTLRGHSGSVTSVAFSPDGETLASGSWDETIKLWDISSGNCLRTLRGHSNLVGSVAFSPDGRTLASGSTDNTIKLWDVSSGKCLRTLEGHSSTVNSVAFSPDGRTLASGSTDNTIKFWDVSTGKCLRTLRGHFSSVYSVVLSPDGRVLASGSSDNTIKLWDVTTGKCLYTLRGHSGDVNSVVFSPDGRTLASGGDDNTIRVWDVSSGECLRTLKGDLTWLVSVAFSPDGSTLASGILDKIKLWDVSSGECLHTLERHPDGVFSDGVLSVAFSPDGRTLASGGSWDETIQLLDVSGLIRGGTAKAGKPTYPAKLRGTISFSEPSGNDILDAGENASLKLHLTNEGKGNAYDLTFKIKPATNYPNIAIANPVPIKSLLAGKTTTVDIPLKASMDLSDGEVAYTVFVSEANGFNLDPPLKIRFRTQALRPPNLIVADYAIDDFNHNRKIERSEIVKVTARIQNTGAGEAKQVKATVSVGKNVFLTSDSKRDFDLGEMTSGQYKDISFSLFTNNIATSLPVTVTLSESYNRYGSTKRLDLPFNVVQKKASELVVQGKSEKPVTIKSAPQLVPDVDKNIPKGGKPNPNAVAVVIGISDYQNPNVPRAKFAKRDASVMREYLVQALGYDPENILPRNPDDLITAGTFKTLIRRKLPAYIRSGESDVFIYYSGHGAPSTATQEAFFVPYDCDPNYANRDNAYSVKEFYDDVAKLKARSITLVIDACYTGQMGNGGMLINNASPVLIKVDNLLVTKSNAVVFTASTEEQVANWYPEKKHGMFTYFFLKGLQGAADFNGDKQVTVGEMQRYLTDPTNGVPYWSNRKFQRPQTPVVMGDKDRVLVRY